MKTGAKLQDGLVKGVEQEYHWQMMQDLWNIIDENLINYLYFY